MGKENVETVVDLVFVAVESICKIILLFMAVVVTLQVVFRAFGGNISWCEEIMLFLLDTLMFLLLPVGIKEDLHIRVEAFAKYFPKKARISFVYISDVVMLLVSLCMIWYGRLLMNRTYAKLTITGLPRKYLYLVTVISGVLCSAVLISQLCGLYKSEGRQNFIDGVGDSAKDIKDEE